MPGEARRSREEVVHDIGLAEGVSKESPTAGQARNKGTAAARLLRQSLSHKG
jgi:hypothetical protein